MATETKNNVTLIDPISSVTKFPEGLNGTPEYEKMFTFVSLKAVRRHKSILIKEDGIVSSENTADDVSIDMLGYDQDTGQFTSKWSENVTGVEPIFEGFGISNLKVTINSSYIPQVEIEFTDIRGSAFFNLGKKSPYSVLFDFPPPIFKLSLKGYYGKSLTYDLHIVRHTTKFDSKTGNYVTSAKFIARTFAPLTDIPFKYIEIFPLMGNVEKTDPSQLTAPKNTHDLITKFRSLNEALSDLHTDSIESKNVSKLNAKLEKAETLINSLNNFKNLVPTNYEGLSSFVKKIPDVDNGLGENIDTFDVVDSVNAFNSVFSPDDDKIKVENADVKFYLAVCYETKVTTIKDGAVEKQGDDKSEDTKKKKEDTLKLELEKIIKNYIELGSFMEATSGDIPENLDELEDYIPTTNSNDITKTNTYFGIDITTFYSNLYKFIKNTEKELEEKNSVLTSSASNLVYRILGMEKPSIYAIFKIICDDIDLFFNTLRKTSSDGENHHNKHKDLILNNKNVKDKKNDNVGAFPLYITKTNTNCVVRDTRTIPTDLSKTVVKAGGGAFPEITLIDAFVQSYIGIEKEKLNSRNKEKLDEFGNKSWIPVTPIDSVLLNASAESPYADIERQHQGIDNTIEKIFNTLIERFSIALQYSFGLEDINFITRRIRSDIDNLGLARFIGGAEGVNLAQSITDKEIIGKLREIIADKAPALIAGLDNGGTKNIFNSVTGNIAEPTSKFLPTIGESNFDFYKDRKHADFTGIEILSESEFPELRSLSTNANSSPVDDYMKNEAPSGFKSFINFFKGEELDVNFTKENILYTPDVNGSDDYGTRYINPTGFGNEIPTVTKLTRYNFGEALKAGSYTNSIATMFSVGTFAEDLLIFLNGGDKPKYKNLLISSNYLTSRTFFHTKNNGTKINEFFTEPSILGVPLFSILYMGGLIEYNDDTEFQSEFDAILNNLLPTNATKAQAAAGTAFRISPIHIDSINKFKEDAEIVDKLLSQKDKDKFQAVFNDLSADDDFNELKIKLISLLTEVIDDSGNVVGGEDEGVDRIRAKQSIYKESLENGTPRNKITKILTQKNALVVKNQFAFNIPPKSGDDYIFTDIEIGVFEPMSLTESNVYDDPDERDLDLLRQTFFESFLSSLSSHLDDRESEIKNIEEFANEVIDDDDIKSSLYYSFKSISDKWLTSGGDGKIGFPLNKGGSSLIDSFMFVDRAMNPIGDDCVIDVQPLLDLSLDYDVNIFSVISQLLSHNGFEFFPLQNFMSFKNDKWEDSFKIIETADQDAVPAFVCMYVGGAASMLNNQFSDYEDDGIQDLLADGLPDFDGGDCDNLSDEVKGGKKLTNIEQPYSKVNAFRVKFAEQNQSFFSQIQLDGADFPETNDSLAILSKIAADDSTSSPIPKGQNLFNLYENRAYSSKVTMLGNMMIQPTQYYQLENIPMYSGAYIVLNVEHTFTPNHAVTTFEGTKVLKYPNPVVTDFITTVGFNGNVGSSVAEANALIDDLRNTKPFLNEAIRKSHNIVGETTDYDKQFPDLKKKHFNKIDTLHINVRNAFALLIDTWDKAGFDIIINSTFRNESDQQRVSEENENNPDLPTASFGRSFHNYGLAMDVSVVLDGVRLDRFTNPHWNEMAIIAEDLGFRWGGNFNNSDDVVHFEKTLGWGYGTNDVNKLTSGGTKRYDTKGTITTLENRSKRKETTFKQSSGQTYVKLHEKTKDE